MKTTIHSTLTALAAALLLTPTTALACGGFFCFTQPVDQSAERILYIQDGDKIAVHIQISYTGEDEQFSWILPLLSVPTLGIGSDSIFQLLEGATAPRFQLDWQTVPNCQGPQYCAFASAGGSSTGGGTGDGSGGVEVLDQGNVGPYDYVVLKSGDATELIEWLNKNKYVQPAESKPLIESYVKGKYVFLALKLAKDSSAGDIAPVVVTLDENSPCLPLRLTKIAAQPDMPIVAWVLGNHRAIPKNFLHVQLNEATLDWMNPGANYKSVVSKAVDQAAGHAFTTEFAKKTASWTTKFATAQWQSGKFSIAELAKAATPMDFMRLLIDGGYPRTTQMQNLLRKHVPKPAKYKDIDDRDFYNCLGSQNTSAPCSDYKAEVLKQPFDAQKFADAVMKELVQPLVSMDEAMLSHAFLTRLYTTVDPQEMDKDPIFAFNKDLPEVDNMHKAKATPICEGTAKQAKTAKLELADGNVITVPIPDNSNCQLSFAGGRASFGTGTGAVVKDGGQPAARIEVLDESGPPLAIHPADADLVDAQLNAAKAGTPSLTDAFKKTLRTADWDYKDPKFDPGPSTSSSSGASSGGASSTGGSSSGGGSSSSGGDSGCSAASGLPGKAAPLLLLMAFALIAVLRRREQAVVATVER